MSSRCKPWFCFLNFPLIALIFHKMSSHLRMLPFTKWGRNLVHPKSVFMLNTYMQDRERLSTTLSIIIQNITASFRRFLCGTVVRGKHQKGENMASWWVGIQLWKNSMYERGNKVKRFGSWKGYGEKGSWWGQSVKKAGGLWGKFMISVFFFSTFFLYSPSPPKKKKKKENTIF